MVKVRYTGRLSGVYVQAPNGQGQNVKRGEIVELDRDIVDMMIRENPDDWKLVRKRRKYKKVKTGAKE